MIKESGAAPGEILSRIAATGGLDEAFEQGRAKAGDLILMGALGAGFSWGSAVVRL